MSLLTVKCKRRATLILNIFYLTESLIRRVGMISYGNRKPIRMCAHHIEEGRMKKGVKGKRK